jgi:hypothetical protein
VENEGAQTRASLNPNTYGCLQGDDARIDEGGDLEDDDDAKIAEEEESGVRVCIYV